MRTAAAYRALGGIDARSVARDSLLRWVVVVTPALGVVVRFAVPPIAVELEARLGFDLTAHYRLLMSFVPLIAAGTIGTVVGFLLLDQRDEQTLTALLVTPLSLGDYLRYRLGALLAVTVALSSITLLIAGLTTTTALQLAVTSVVAAPLAPIYALFLSSFASNKVQGFALAKIVGIVIVPCIAAYFVSGPWQTAFGIVPHYWALKVFWLFDSGAPVAALAHAAAGLLWQALILIVLVRNFARALRR